MGTGDRGRALARIIGSAFLTDHLVHSKNGTSRNSASLRIMSVESSVKTYTERQYTRNTICDRPYVDHRTEGHNSSGDNVGPDLMGCRGMGTEIGAGLSGT